MIHCKSVGNTIHMTIVTEKINKKHQSKRPLPNRFHSLAVTLAKKATYINKSMFCAFRQLHKQLFHTEEWMTYIKKGKAAQASPKPKAWLYLKNKIHSFDCINNHTHPPMLSLQASKRGTSVCVKSHMTASPLFCSSDYGLSCFKRGRNLTNTGSLSRHFWIQVWAHFLRRSQI